MDRYARSLSRSRSRDRGDRDRDRTNRRDDRDRDRDRYKDRERERDRERDRDRESNSLSTYLSIYQERDKEKKDKDNKDRSKARDKDPPDYRRDKKDNDRSKDRSERKGDERTRDRERDVDSNGKRERNGDADRDRDTKRRRSSRSRSKSNERDHRNESTKTRSNDPISAGSRVKGILTINTRPVVNVFASNSRLAASSKSKVVSFVGEEGELLEPNVVEEEDELVDLDLDSKKESEEEEAQRLAAERRLRLQKINSKYQQKEEPLVLPTQPVSLSQKENTPATVSTEQLPDSKATDKPLNDAVVNAPAAAVTRSVSGSSEISRSSTALSSSISLENLSIMEEAQAAANPYETLLLSIAQQEQEQAQEHQQQIAAAEAAAEAAAAAVATDGDDERRQLEAEKSALEAEEQQKNGGKKFVFDIFSASPSELEQKQHYKAGQEPHDKSAGAMYPTAGGLGRRASREALLEGESPHLQSNWDDGEGYYKARVGELIGDRFQTLGVVGKGVFSTVLKCVDLRGGDGSQHVAIKMIRNNDTMRKAAEKEKSILSEIAEKDPENRKHCVRMLMHLDYRSHVALVFEFQQMNLREALKKFGKDVGINIGAVRIYGRQLFYALRHLADLRVVHADIKLDNILCSGDLKQVKLCDFGSAFRETDSDNDPTPYLVSRFYRAPEIILGLPYDRAIDLWSVCLCLYELFTGHVMFPGRSNNEMLRLIMAIKGRFGHKQLKAHQRSYETLGIEAHFDPDFRFRHYEADPVTGKTILRLVDIANPTRDLATILRGSKAGADDMKLVNMLNDLLERGLHLDPSKRMSVLECMKHPFIAVAK